MSERQGVEIDYCPNCRGIWLDRGELDKIVDKVIANEKGNPAYQAPPPAQPMYPQQPHRDYKHHDSHDYYKHRKKHWLNELFD
jgi:Zn-finger nucleic acid-binding protein